MLRSAVRRLRRGRNAMNSHIRSWGRRQLVALSVAVPLILAGFGGMASSALAGNFWATGHDQDYHCSPAGSDPNECSYYKITTSFVRASSTAPILILDRD